MSGQPPPPSLRNEASASAKLPQPPSASSSPAWPGLRQGWSPMQALWSQAPTEAGLCPHL